MPTVGAAFNFLEENASHLFKNAKSLLYVGHRYDTSPWWHKIFASKIGIERIAVIDIVKDNMMSAAEITKELYCGDIRDKDIIKDCFDLVFWDEGPEHMSKQESLEMMTQLSKTHKQLLISCPWGYQAQGSGPNDHEFHHWGPLPEDFESIGMITKTFGTIFPSGHGNLIAWTERTINE